MMPSGPSPAGAPAGKGLRLFAVLLAVATFLVTVAGGAVTSTRSGLADPDWPPFNGRLYPSLAAMLADRGLFFEHGHRIIAGTVVACTWVLAIVLLVKRGPRAARRLAMAAAVAGLVPAALGGLTVLAKLPPEASIAHVAAAMAFLSLNVAVATVLGRRWVEAPAEAAAGAIEPVEAAALARGAIFCAVAVYAQIILGAVPRHLHGGVEGVAPHILWAFAVATAGILLAARIWSRHARLSGLLHLGLAFLFLIVLQFFLGFAAFLNRPKGVKAPGSPLYEVTASVHQAAGVLMLTAAVVLALRARRYQQVSSKHPGLLPADLGAVFPILGGAGGRPA